MYKIHQSCREAKDFPEFVCVLCLRGIADMSKFANRKLGGRPTVKADATVVTSIIYPDSSGIKLEDSDVKRDETEENGGKDHEEFSKRKSPRKHRSSRNRPDVGFDAEFSDISSADDETAFEKEERANSRSRRHRDRGEDDQLNQEKVVVEGKHEISKPIVNQFHPAIRDLTKPPKGTKFTTRRNAVGGQFQPRPPTDGQQKKEPVNLIKLDPQTILGLASSGNPANIEKAEELLQQLASRFGGFTGSKATIALNNSGNQRGNQHHQNYEENKPYNRDNRGRGGDRFDYKGTWGNKQDNRGGDHRRGHGGHYRRDDKSFHRNNQSFRRGRSGDKHRSKSREHDDRRGGGSRDRNRYDSNRNRRYEQYANSSPKQATPPKEKPNLTHVPKSLVDHVVRDIEKEALAKAEAEEKMRTEAIEAKKKIEEELRQIQEEEDAKRREKEDKKAAATVGGWKPLGESETAEKASKSDEEPEEGEAEDSGEDGESSSSSSSSDSESSSDDADKKASENDGTASEKDDNDENKRPDVSKLLEPEPEPEIELTEEEQLMNLQKFSEQANEYKKRFRALEDSIRKLHTDVVFYAERCDQDMIQGVQSQCNLYNLEINKLFQFCKGMKPFATAEGTKIQINTFVIKIGDAETELKKARGVVDEFAQLIEKIIILEELLVEQIKEEALIVEPIMKDLRIQPKVLLDKVRSEIESALTECSENPKSLHRNYELFVNKLNSMLRGADVKSDKVASLEASVMEHQENLGKHLKELRLELNDRNNLKSYVDEIAKLLTSHKNTAEHIESTKSHPDRAMSCIQSLRKEYKRLSKATDKYRVKYSSANLELPDGMEEILCNLKETKAQLEIELEQLVTKCEGWKREAAPLLTSAFAGGASDGKSADESFDSKKKGFGFQLKLSDQTQKVIKDGNQLLKAQSSTAEQNVVSDSSDSEEKELGNRSDDELTTKIPDYLAPLPKPIDHNPQPIMPLPPVSSVISNSVTTGPTGTLLPPVPPQMPNVPVPPTFQPPFMSMPVPPMFAHPPPHQMPPIPPAFVPPPMGQQNPMNPPPGNPMNFPPPPGIPIQFPPQMPPNAPYMQPQPHQVTFSAAPSLIQAQPMHYVSNAVHTPHMHHSIAQSPSVQTPIISMPSTSTDAIIASDVVSSMPDSSLIEAAAKALENVISVSSLENTPVKSSADSQRKKKKRKKNEGVDSDIEAIESFPKPQSLDLSSVAINLGTSSSPETLESKSAKDMPDLEAPTLQGLSKKAKKEKRRKYRKGGFQDEELEESESQSATQDVQYPQESNKKPSAFSYAAAMIGLESNVLNAEETYDPAEPTIVNYNHAVDTNSYEVVYRPEQADFVLVQKNSEAAATAHAQQQQITDALSKAQNEEEGVSDAELDEESLKKKEQIKKERKERKKAQKEALRKERELEREEEMKQGKKAPSRGGPISSMLSILSHLDENKNEQEEKPEEKEEEIIEPITCIQINTSSSPTAKDANANKLRPDVKRSPQVVNSTTESLSPTPVSTTQGFGHDGKSAGKGNVSPFMSNKVTSSQPALESELLLKQTSRLATEDGEEEEGELNSEDELEARKPTSDDKKRSSPPVLQDKQVNSSVKNVPPVSFSQEEATSTIADEMLLKPPPPPPMVPSQLQVHLPTSSASSTHPHKTSASKAKVSTTPTGHVINFEEESADDESEDEENEDAAAAASPSSEDEQPSLVPSGKSGKSKKVTSMVPPPPPERKRNKKQDKKVVESTTSSDESGDDSSSSSSEEEPQLTKKQLKKMMKFYAMFAKSKGSAKSKKKTKKRKKSDSVDDESSDDEMPPMKQQKKPRRHSNKKQNAESSDSDDSTDLVTPKKKAKKSKSAKSTPSSSGKQANKSQLEHPQEGIIADDSDEISMSSFFNQDDSLVSSVASSKTSKPAKSQLTSPTSQTSPSSLLTPEAAIERFLPEFSSNSDPPVSALSRHFSSFWDLFPVKNDKEAALARQIAIGLLETAISYNQEGKTTVPIQTQMVLTMLKNMKSW